MSAQDPKGKEKDRGMPRSLKVERGSVRPLPYAGIIRIRFKGSLRSA